MVEIVPTLHTARMMLRPLRAEDEQEFLRVQRISADLHAPWVPAVPAGHTIEDAFTSQLARGIYGMGDRTEYRLVGIARDGRIAGFFNLFQVIRGVFQNSYASWSINAEFSRQGFCTEGVIALLDFAYSPQSAFPRSGSACIAWQANIIPDNVASIRVAEKAGFRREGLAKNYLQIAGRWQDHYMYAKLADEHPLTNVLPPRIEEGAVKALLGDDLVNDK